MDELPPVIDRPAGRMLARGREATIHEFGHGLVLRRYDDGRDVTAEVTLMRHVARHGMPVPKVHGVQLDAGGRPVAMVLDRIEGPTLVEAGVAGAVSAADVGRTLAELHARLHRVPLDGLPVSPEPPARQSGHVVVHLDLHPANVLVAPEGPVLIDWSIARTGPAALDTAMTAMTLAAAVVAGIPSDAGDVSQLEIDRSFLAATLDSYLTALSEPPTPALDRAASILDLVGAQPPQVVRAALGVVRDALARAGL
ncbi:MAG: phosphotransferase [Cellulomonas sp.]